MRSLVCQQNSSGLTKSSWSISTKSGVGKGCLAVGLLLIVFSNGMWISSVRADTAECVNDPGVGISLTARARPPCDYRGTVSRTGLYRFAWNTFFALNWPAQDQQADGSHRGKPNEAASYGVLGGMPVWDTWRGKRELFRPTLRKTWNAISPGVFSAFPPTTDPNPNTQACSGVQQVPGRQVMQSNKVDNSTDETDEIGLTLLWSQVDPISGAAAPLPTENTVVRYQVKFNKDHWDYVTAEGIFSTTALNNMMADKSLSKLGSVSFPAGSNSSISTGSILTKSAWKMLSAAEAASGEYFTVDAYYFVQADKDTTEVCYKPATFALIALHVIRKTESFPTFFFSTFEHKNNYPGKFYYANTNGGAPSSLVQSGYNIPYNSPANPKVNVQADLGDYQAQRLVPVTAALNNVNVEADAVNGNSVWANYRLVGAQYLPVDGQNNIVDPSLDQDFFLANPVVETNQRFQYFDGGFGASGKVNVALDPTTSGKGTVNMGGCMGCHGNAQIGGTDFSFTLANVQGPPENQSAAETLADKCDEVGLVASADGLSCVNTH